MNNNYNIISEIYDKPAEDLPELAAREINNATGLLEKYANKMLKKLI